MRRYNIKVIKKKFNNDPKNTPKFQVIAPAALASANVLYFFVPFLPRSTTNLFDYFIVYYFYLFFIIFYFYL